MVVVMQKNRRMRSLILSGSRRLAQLFGNALSTQLAPLFKETLYFTGGSAQKAIVQVMVAGMSTQVHTVTVRSK